MIRLRPSFIFFDQTPLFFDATFLEEDYVEVFE